MAAVARCYAVYWRELRVTEPNASPGTSSWQDFWAQLADLWAQAQVEIQHASGAQAADIYAKAAQEALSLLLRIPSADPATDAGGIWLKWLGPAPAAELAEPVMRVWLAVLALQGPLSEFVTTEREVLLAGYTVFGQRAAALAPGEMSPRRLLDVWIAALDEVHASAQLTQAYVLRHTALIHALADVSDALAECWQLIVRRLNLATRDAVERLEMRILALEQQLSVAKDADVRPGDLSPIRVAKKITSAPRPGAA